jgi:hypothetical protein
LFRFGETRVKPDWLAFFIAKFGAAGQAGNDWQVGAGDKKMADKKMMDREGW